MSWLCKAFWNRLLAHFLQKRWKEICEYFYIHLFAGSHSFVAATRNRVVLGIPDLPPLVRSCSTTSVKRNNASCQSKLKLFRTPFHLHLYWVISNKINTSWIKAGWRIQKNCPSNMSFARSVKQKGCAGGFSCTQLLWFQRPDMFYLNKVN